MASNRSAQNRSTEATKTHGAPRTPAAKNLATPSGKARHGAAPRDAASTDCPGGNGEDKQRAIAVAAYFLAEKRGFADGAALDDWLAAEAQFEFHASH